MRLKTYLAAGVALAIGGLVFTSNTVMAADMSHAHMGHVMTAWGDTPDGKGLLPTAISEAKIAAQHAGFAAKKLDNLGWMQTHAHHVLNAIDPSVEMKGPGMGYGVIKAASGAAKHIGLAAKSEGASKAVKLHATHISTSATNTVTRGHEIVALGKKILAATSAADAAPYVQKMAQLTQQLTAGMDANGDDTITWKKGEGGLDAANFHLKLLAKSEGMVK